MSSQEKKGKSSVQAIRKWLEEKNRSPIHNPIHISGVYGFNIAYKPLVNERQFNLNVALVDTGSVGAAYYFFPEINMSTVRDIAGSLYQGQPLIHPALELAAIDSYCAHFPIPVKKEYSINGTGTDKAKSRAELLVSSITSLLPSRPSRILIIGAVYSIIKLLRDRNNDVDVCDMDISLRTEDKFSTYNFIEVEDVYKNNLNYDLALITGMTITNGDCIPYVEALKQQGCKIAFFCHTGAHLAEWLLDIGSDVVISEPFPFYILSGSSIIRVYEN